MTAYPQARAWRLVKKAVRRGELVRGPCSRCGAARAHGHHADYARPLDVVWLCARCHKAEHRAMTRSDSERVHDDSSASRAEGAPDPGSDSRAGIAAHRAYSPDQEAAIVRLA